MLQSAHVCDGEEGGGWEREGGETRESARRTGNGGQKKCAVDGGARRARTSRAIASLVPMATRGAIGGVASERTHPVVALLLQLAKYRGSLGRRHCPGSFSRRLSAWCAVSDARARRRVCGAEVPSAPTSLVRPRGPRKGCERSKRINERIDPLSTVREPKRPDGPGSPRRRSRDSDRNLLSKVCTRHVWLSDASRHCERAGAYLAILCGARGGKALGGASRKVRGGRSTARSLASTLDCGVVRSRGKKRGSEALPHPASRATLVEVPLALA